MADTILYSSTNQASAILTSTTQGPSGSLSSPTGTGFVHVTSGAIDGAARAVGLNSSDVSGVLQIGNGGLGLSSYGTASQVLVMNSGGTALTWGSVPLAVVVAPTGTGVALVSGGVWSPAAGTVNLASSTYVSGVLPFANMQAPTGTGPALVSAGAWSAASGPVLLNGGSTWVSGTLPLTNEASPTGTGVALVSGGSWVAAAGTVNLASSTYVSGLLPNANVAPGSSGQVMLTNATPATAWTTLTGDVALSGAGVSTVASAQYGQTGALTFGASTGTITAATGATAPGIVQASTAANSGVNMVFAPQASTAANGTPGNFITALAAYTGAGSAPYSEVTYAGVAISKIGIFPGGPTWGTMWLGNASAAATSGTNYALAGDNSGTITILNAAVSVSIRSGNTGVALFSASLESDFAANVAIGTLAGGSFGGGAGGVLGISKASTNPATATTSSVIYADSSTGALGIWAPGDTTAKGPTLSIASGAVSGSLGQTFTLGMAQTAGTTYGLYVNGQYNNAAGTGGPLYLQGGYSTGTTGAVYIDTLNAVQAGVLTLSVGSSSAAAGTGSGLSISAGSASGSGTTTGGLLSLIAGSSIGGSGGTGGIAKLWGGPGVIAGGAVSVAGGSASGGNGGSVGISGGAGTGGVGGNVTVQGGAGTTSGAASIADSSGLYFVTVSGSAILMGGPTVAANGNAVSGGTAIPVTCKYFPVTVGGTAYKLVLVSP